MTLYRDLLGGSPYQYQGNLLARKAASPSLLNKVGGFIGARPLSVVAPATANLLDYAEQEASDSGDNDTSASDTISALLPRGSDKIQTTPEGMQKASDLAASAAQQSSDTDSDADLTQQNLMQSLNTILGTNQPAQAYKQVSDLPIWKDKGFISGVLTLLVAAASGMRPMQGLQLAMAAKHRGEARQFLELNQNILNAQYDPMSVENAIQSGDMSKLKTKTLTPQQQFQLDLLKTQLTGQMTEDRQKDYAKWQQQQQEAANTSKYNRGIMQAALTGQLSGSGLTSTGNVTPEDFALLEGSGNKAVSPKGAYGKYQIMSDFWKDYAPQGAPSNVKDATLEQQRQAVQNYIDRNPGKTDAELVAGYNGGLGRVNALESQYGSDWINHLPSETTDYLGRYLSQHPATGFGTKGATKGKPIDFSDPDQAKQWAQTLLSSGEDISSGTPKRISNAQDRADAKIQASKILGIPLPVDKADPMGALSSTEQKYATTLAANANKSTQLNKQRLAGYLDARNFLNDYDAALARGDKSTAQALIPSINNAIARSELGGTGMLPSDEVDRVVNTGGWGARAWNMGSEGLTGLYSDAMEKRLKSMANTGGSTVADNINRVYDHVEKNLENRGVDPDTAKLLADEGRAEDFKDYIMSDGSATPSVTAPPSNKQTYNGGTPVPAGSTITTDKDGNPIVILPNGKGYYLDQ